MGEELDATTLVRRAHEQGNEVEPYSAGQLIIDVMELLRERGLHPELPPDTGRVGTAIGASGKLLRAFGILPATGYSSTDRPNAPDDW